MGASVRVVVVGGLGAVVLAVAGVALAQVGPHAQLLERHRFDEPFEAGPPLSDAVVAAAREWEEAWAQPGAERTRAARGVRSDLEVIGYLPSWGDAGITGLRFDVMTQVNYFSLEMDGTGDIDYTHGWGGTASDDLITAAHAQGCRVLVTVTNFSQSSLNTLLSSPSNRANAVANLVDQAVSGGADGVDVDFEGMDDENKQDLVDFMQELQAALQAAMANPWTTLATPAVDWRGAYDYDELMYASNGLFIMGYGFHYSGSDPGPNAPKYGSNLWGGYSLDWSLEDYIEYGGEANRHEVYLGLPLYGRDWPSVSDDIPGEATEDGLSITYTSSVADAQVHGRQWDPESDTPYYMYQSQGWHQVWYDDDESVLSKVELVGEHDIGGFGFWALQFDGNDPLLWDELALIVGDDDDTGDDDTGDDDTGDDDTGDDDDTEDDDDDTSGDDDVSGLYPPPHTTGANEEEADCECTAPGPPDRRAALALGIPGLFLIRRRLGPRGRA